MDVFYRDKSVRLRIDCHCIWLNDDRSTVGHLSLIIRPSISTSHPKNFVDWLDKGATKRLTVSTSAYLSSEWRHPPLKISGMLIAPATTWKPEFGSILNDSADGAFLRTFSVEDSSALSRVWSLTCYVCRRIAEILFSCDLTISLSIFLWFCRRNFTSKIFSHKSI